MDRPASGIAGQPRQIERLGDDALAGEGSVAVHQDRQRGVGILARGAGLVALLLRGTGTALDHRVDILQVAGVGRQGQRHRLEPQLFVGFTRAEVVFDVAGVAERAFPLGRGADIAVGGLERGQDLAVGFAEDVGQDVQPAAVGHAHHHLARAGSGRVADDRVEHGDEHVAALDRETLLAGVGLMQKALKDLDLGEALEQLAFALGVEVLKEALALDRLADPGTLFVDLDVIGLVADRARVDPAELLDPLQRVARLCDQRPAHDLGGQRSQILLGHPVDIQAQPRVAGRLAAERVDMRGQVPQLADIADQPRRADRPGDIERRGHRRGRGRSDAVGRRPALEHGARRRIHRLGVLAVALVEFEDIARVGAVEESHVHGAAPESLCADLLDAIRTLYHVPIDLRSGAAPCRGSAIAVNLRTGCGIPGWQMVCGAHRTFVPICNQRATVCGMIQSGTKVCGEAAGLRALHWRQEAL